MTNSFTVISKKRTARKNMKTLPESKSPALIYIGRWTPRILFSLQERPYRHGELRRHLGSISQRMLTRTLRNLESRGLIARRVTEAKTVAVEYSLTKIGKTIIVPLRTMCRWARRYGKTVSAEVYSSTETPEISQNQPGT